MWGIMEKHTHALQSVCCLVVYQLFQVLMYRVVAKSLQKTRVTVLFIFFHKNCSKKNSIKHICTMTSLNNTQGVPRSFKCVLVKQGVPLYFILHFGENKSQHTCNFLICYLLSLVKIFQIKNVSLIQILTHHCTLLQYQIIQKEGTNEIKCCIKISLKENYRSQRYFSYPCFNILIICFIIQFFSKVQWI